MVEAIFTELIPNVLIIGISFLALNWASNLAISNALKVSAITQLGKTAVGFSLIAFSTSLPELTVALIAALSGGAAISVGNVFGSNIVNISVIIGLAAVLLHLKKVKGKVGFKEFFLHLGRYTKTKPSEANNKINVIPTFAKSELSSIYFGLFIASIVPLILIYISGATWAVGLILLFIFVGYMYKLSKVRLPSEDGEVPQEEKNKLKRYLLFTIVGALGVVVSAYFLVESAVSIATSVGLSQQNHRCNNNCFWHKSPRTHLRLESFLARSPCACVWRHNRQQLYKYHIDFRHNSFCSSTDWFPISYEDGCF